MKLSDAQFGALHQIVDHGPISAEEVIGPRKVKFVCNCLTSATMQKLQLLNLVSVERVEKNRPVSATGQKGHRRVAVTINITDDGRKALSQYPPHGDELFVRDADRDAAGKSTHALTDATNPEEANPRD